MTVRVRVTIAASENKSDSDWQKNNSDDNNNLYS